MTKKALLIGLLLAAAGVAVGPTVVQAQPGAPPPSPYAPQPDKPTCTMAELKAATAAYVAAQKAGDVSGMPLDPKAHYLENMTTVDKAKGMWNSKLAVADAISFHDPLRCKTFTQIIVNQGDTPYVIGTRLYLNGGKIIRLDSLVTKKGDWLFNANAYLKYSTKEDWGDLKAGQATPASEMIRGANAYLDSFADKFTEVPWGTPCARLEGGAYTNRDNKPDASCNVGIPAGVLYIVNRDYVVDPEKGVINVFCRFGSATGMADSHTFRYVGGKIHAVHTLSLIPGGGAPQPQANDEGGIVGRPAPAAAAPKS
jgi:hypothetical protein